jgi:two-component system cell cycle response regulator
MAELRSAIFWVLCPKQSLHCYSIRSHPIAVSSGLLFPLTISIGGVVTALENQNQQIPDLSFDELVLLAKQSLLQAQKSGGDLDYLEIFE